MTPARRVQDICRKGCCWTPFGTCAKDRACVCHMTSAGRAAMVRPLVEAKLDMDELERRRVLRSLRERGKGREGRGWTRNS